MKKFLWNEVDTYDNFADFCTGMNQKFGPKPAVSYFDRRGDEICYTYQEMTDQAAGLRAVSYTHLDVYKRQGAWKS